MQAAQARVNGVAALERVLTTAELQRRPARTPDVAAQNRALIALSRQLAGSPQQILQLLCDTARDLCRAGSAGVNVIDGQQHAKASEQVFRSHAVSGALATHLEVATPQHLGPFGTAVELDTVWLMSHLTRPNHSSAAARPEIFEALLMPFKIDGRTIGTVWMCMHNERDRFDPEDQRLLHDLAEFAAAGYQLRSAVDASRDADRRKDAFLATVAHELRNPLNAVRLAARYTSIRLRDVGDAQVRAMHARSERQMESMIRIIDDLADVTRIRLGRIALRRARFDVGEVVQQAVDSCRGEIDAAGHQLEISLPAGPLWVHGDAMRLTQVAINLINNAVKYTPDGGMIEVSAERTGGAILLRIRDNGIGIPVEHQSRIFDLFAQEELVDRPSQGGLGIGLTLVRHLVELHGGRVEVRSGGTGHGSEFNVRLPLDT